jgi:hypothetical protein
MSWRILSSCVQPVSGGVSPSRIFGHSCSATVTVYARLISRICVLVGSGSESAAQVAATRLSASR